MRTEERAARHQGVLELSVSVSAIGTLAISVHGAAVERSRDEDEQKEGLDEFHGAHWNRIATA